MNTIKKIYWERANIYFQFDKKINNTIYLTNNNINIPLEKNNEKEFYINITNINGTMLDSGTWILKIEDEKINIPKEIYNSLDDLSRNFKYRSNLYAYLVNFIISPDSEIKMVTQFMMINHKPKSFFRLNETKRIKRKIEIIINIVAVHCANLVYRIFR